MASTRPMSFYRPVIWVVVTLVLTSGLYWWSAGSFAPGSSPQSPVLQEAQERLKTYFNDYAKQLDIYNAALETGNGPALARADEFLNNHRQRMAQQLGSYLSLLTKLPSDGTPLIAQLQILTADPRFQFTSTSLSQGRLVQVSVRETEFDVRHLTLWQFGTRVLALNSYETEWQAQVTAVRFFKFADQQFLIANGQTQQLEDQAPFIKIYQQVGADLRDKTSLYLPIELMDTFGTSEFLGPTANLKLDTMVLDPQHIMAACDSCGLVAQRALWQWSAKGYTLVERQIANEPENALYAGLVVLAKRDTAPTWVNLFLTLKTRTALIAAPPFTPDRYSALEQGFAVTDTQPWQTSGFQYVIEGPFQLKLFVKPNAQGQWEVVEVRDLKTQAPGWTMPYVRERRVVAS